MINYSIIIPHHNTPDLLKKCIESIPAREDIQIIVIDDNSDPNIVNSETFPIKNRDNIEIIFNKIGKGAGHARNLGLDRAIGKWLFFVDADDYLLPGSFETIDKYINSTADIIYFGFDSVYADTGLPAQRHKYIEDILNYTINEPQADRHDYIRFKHVVPSGKLIRKSMVDAANIRFDEVWYSNDVMFSVKTGWLAEKILVDLTNVYVITVSKGSLTQRRNLKNFMSRYDVCLRHNAFVRSINRSQYQMSIMYYYINIMKYGIGPWWKATKMMVQYKNNPFFGMKNWIGTILKLKSTIDKKYRTN